MAALTQVFLFLVQTTKCPLGTKPMLVFAGELFDTDNEYKRLKSLLIGMMTLNVRSLFMLS